MEKKSQIGLTHIPDPHRPKYFRLPRYVEDRMFHIYCENFRIPQRYYSPKHLELITGGP